MTKFDDGLERYARGQEKAMGARVRTSQARASAQARVARGRRRRLIAQGAIVLGTAGVLALGATVIPSWGSNHRTDPAGDTAWDGSMSGARIGDVAPVPDVYAWQQVEGGEPLLPFCTGLWTPPTEPGLTIRDESVRALGISVETALVGAPNQAAGEPIPLTSDDHVSVEARISWFGERALHVTGYAVLVFSDGVMRSVPYANVGTPTGVGGSPEGAAFEARVHHSETGTTEVPVDMPLEPYDCVLHGPNGELLPMVDASGAPSYASYAQYDGDYTLHVVIQVSDEAGVPLATFVDAVRVGDTPFHLEEPAATWNARDDQFVERVDGLQQRVDAQGVALAETTGGMGARNASDTCEQVDTLWAERGSALPVVDIGAADIPFPATLSLADLAGTVVLESNPAVGPNGVPWYYGAEYLTLKRATPDGEVHVALGVAAGFPDDPADPSHVVEATLLFGIPPVDGGCGNSGVLAALEPGTYQAALVLRAAPWEPDLWLATKGHGPVGEFWVDLGEVTITK